MGLESEMKEAELEDKLKPCPFCGSKNLRVFEPGPGEPLFWVSCNVVDCFTIGPYSKTYDEAIGKWNRRNRG